MRCERRRAGRERGGRILVVYVGARAAQQKHGRQIVVAVARVPALQIVHALHFRQTLGLVVYEQYLVGLDSEEAFNLAEGYFARRQRRLAHVKHNLLDGKENAAEAVEVVTDEDVVLFEL